MGKEPTYRRVLLKLSGEALSGGTGFGIDPAVLARLSGEIKDVHDLGVELGIIIGGGNFVRGVQAAAGGMDRTAADQMGMLATVMNAMAMRQALEQIGVPTVILSAVHVVNVVDPYVHRRAMRYLKQKTVVLFAGGTGNPYFSTDTAAALRASEVQADVIFKATKVDGVYDDDPKTNPAAKRFDTLTLTEALSRDLRVMDATAISLCRENRVPIVVFTMNEPGTIAQAVCGETIGTYVGGDWS
jgi:uridylate kinase